MHLQVLNFPETSSGQVFEDGKRAHFTSNPSSYINMHGGAKDFQKNISVNAIKRFLNEKVKQIERENNLLRKSADSKGIKFKDFYSKN